MSKPYKVGIYCRLSRDDAANPAKIKNYIPGDESVSIENQYEMLSKFVMLRGWIEVRTYKDDGYSGGNFQRPGFLEMLEDARAGVINLILVKDLSRLGRDYVEVGRYTDVIFPALGCRFVSVLDCLDTEGDSTDMLHFRSLMNDYHLKDLSNKVKSVLRAKMKRGQYLAAYAPYGYRKSDEDKHKLVIDEDAAAVVRRMYEQRQAGMAYGKIAATLNTEGVLSPRWYWAIHYGNSSCRFSKLWTYTAVKNILCDPVYIGKLVQNRTGTRSYKDKTYVSKPKSDWIIHEDAHEAIVSAGVWNRVQEINRAAKARCENNAPPAPALFSGKLVCADCGKRLVVCRDNQRRKNGSVKTYTSYVCSRYVSSGRSACSWHRIYETGLKALVLDEIRAHAEAVTTDEASVLERLRKQSAASDAARLNVVRQEAAGLRRRIYELEQLTARLYEDKVSGVISESSFASLMARNEHERLQKSDRLEELISEASHAQREAGNIQKWSDMIRRYLALQELDRETVEELIDHIEIGERSVIDGHKQRNVTIYYRFVGAVKLGGEHEEEKTRSHLLPRGITGR